MISCTQASYCVLGRQLAVDQQVGDLEEGGLLGQLLDGVAAVLQDALVAVDVGDGAAAGGGVDEAGVVDRQAGLRPRRTDLAQVGGLDGAVGDRDVVLLAGAVVADGEGCRCRRPAASVTSAAVPIVGRRRLELSRPVNLAGPAGGPRTAGRAF